MTSEEYQTWISPRSCALTFALGSSFHSMGDSITLQLKSSPCPHFVNRQSSPIFLPQKKIFHPLNDDDTKSIIFMFT